MGGDSSSTTTQNQSYNSTTDPYKPAQPLLSGMLGQLSGALGQTAPTQGQTDAVSNYQGYSPQFDQYVSSLLGGGGALNETGKINQAYNNYYNATNPLASNTNYNPYDTPGFKDAINTLTSDITNNVNGSFAAAGRDFSGMNAQTLGRGILQGVAPTIASQYNQNVQNQQGAARDLFNAGNTNAGILSGLQQQFLQNQGQGVSTAGNVLGGLLGAGSAPFATTLQNLGMIANLGIPIAGLGQSTAGTGTGTNNTKGQMSGAQQFATILGGIGSLGNLWPKVSDRRLKEDIEQVGTLFDGSPVYRYRYVGSKTFHIGLMAQDVEQTTPEAVVEVGGYKAVDYKLATDKALEVA